MSTATTTGHQSNLWALFADWAYRTLDRLPSFFEDADPEMLRHMPPF